MLGTATAVLALACAGAQAADIPMDPQPIEYYEAPPPALPLAPWAGPYVGTHIGWTWQDVATSLGPISGGYKPSGSAGGILAGWMFQSGMITFGVEADVTIQETKGQTLGLFPGGVASDWIWNSSLRARVGGDMGRFMPYLTAGVAIGQLHQKLLTAPLGGDARTMTGWTVGAGVDVKLWEPRIVRLEYLYADYGSENFTYGPGVYRTRTDTHTLRAALVTQLGGNSEIKRPYFSGEGRWAGYYGGLAGGWTGSRAKSDGLFPVGPAFNYSINGGNVSLIAGTNWQWGRFVAGLEGDLTYMLGVKGGSALGQVDTKILWTSHNRLRLGFDAGNVLPFVAGGLAITQHEHRRPGFTQIDFSPKWGWSLGAGMDYALGERVSARFEYLYDHLPSVEVVFANGLRNIDLSTHTVRAGLTYTAGP